MKITNFRNVKKIPSKRYASLASFSADVDVTTRTGIFGLKEKTETKQVFKDEFAVNWIWVDSGNWTPGREVENLFKSYCAQETMAGNPNPTA